MLPNPRIIAIDDEKEHVNSLSASLSKLGAGCLPIHFTGDPEDIKACPDVRIVFTDLNLVGGEFESSASFGAIGGLLEKSIKPAGPYLIVLWTRYPDQAASLDEYLAARLKGVTKPFGVIPIDKTQHIGANGKTKNVEALMQEIHQITNSIPPLSALFDWESRVLRATGKTVSSILELVSEKETETRSEKLQGILTRLAIEAVGEHYVQNDRFQAVNQALLPILEDRISKFREDGEQNSVWANSVDVTTTQALSEHSAATLNSMAHIAQVENTESYDRGVVILLLDSIRKDFSDKFGVTEAEAAKSQFRCKNFETKNENFRWVLVQAQAACDYVQRHPGSIPCYLGLDFISENIRRNAAAPESMWSSPVFEIDGSIRCLHVNARFPVSLSQSEFKCTEKIYRLREQILNDLTYKLHIHGGRPGMLSFRVHRS